MKHLCSAAAALLAAAALFSSAAARERPHVVSTDPAHEDRAVDPETARIVVTFSEPMSQTGWSWCGGGDAFPEITGDPYFEDERTAVLPVTLKPQHTYTLSINCPAAANFRTAGGDPVEPYPLTFTTASGEGATESWPLENGAALARVEELVERRYAYQGHSGVDWSGEWEKNRSWILSAPNAGEWATRVATVLAKAEDPHVYLTNRDGSLFWNLYGRNVQPNVDEDQVVRTVADFRSLSDNVSTGQIGGDSGYLAVSGWTGHPADVSQMHQAMEELSAFPALIIDVRLNGGGDEIHARKLAGWFLEEDAVYAKNRYRNAGGDGWGPVHERVVEANPPEARYEGFVAVLQGPACISANESFIMMMQQAPRAVTAGETSGGSSGNPRAYELPNGMLLYLSSWQDMTPEGELIEDRGIEPGIPVRHDSASFKDATILRAAEELRGRLP